MMTATTMTTTMIPTTAPALKIPAIAEQLLNHVPINNMAMEKIYFSHIYSYLARVIIISQVIGRKGLGFAIIQLHLDLVANRIDNFAFSLRRDHTLAF
jgi:hypothetical protein